MQSRKQSHLNVKGHLKLIEEWKQKWNNLTSWGMPGMYMIQNSGPDQNLKNLETLANLGQLSWSLG